MTPVMDPSTRPSTISLIFRAERGENYMNEIAELNEEDRTRKQ